MKTEHIKIDDDFIRLDNLIKFGGFVSSGGQGKVLIQSGFVTLDGEVCTQRGKKVYKGSKVQYKGNTIIVE